MAKTDSKSVKSAVATLNAVETSALMERLTKIDVNNSDSYRSGQGLSQIRIQNETIKGMNLDGVEFNYTHFENVVFEDCNLRNSEFHMAEFHNVKFIGCSGRNSEFFFSKFENTSFEKCVFSNTNFEFTKGNMSFTECQLDGTEFPMSELVLIMTDCNAKRIEANSITLELNAAHSSFVRGSFDNAELKGKVTECDLTDACFNRANIAEFDMSESIIAGIETEDTVGNEFEILDFDEEDDDDFL